MIAVWQVAEKGCDSSQIASGMVSASAMWHKG